MSTAARVTLTLPRKTLARLDDVAKAERRSRSNAATILLDQVLAAGRRRLEELEQIAEAGIAKSRKPSAAAAREHLAEHGRLSGFTPSTEESSDNA